MREFWHGQVLCSSCVGQLERELGNGGRKRDTFCQACRKKEKGKSVTPASPFLLFINSSSIRLGHKKPQHMDMEGFGFHIQYFSDRDFFQTEINKWGSDAWFFLSKKCFLCHAPCPRVTRITSRFTNRFTSRFMFSLKPHSRFCVLQHVTFPQ